MVRDDRDVEFVAGWLQKPVQGEEIRLIVQQ
jgi:hypothetical protein